MKNILSSYFENSSQDKIRSKKTAGPVIAISRECGCSAKRIATKLSKILTGYSYMSDTKTNVEWKWVSKEIIEQAAIELELDPGKVKNVFLGEAKTSLHEVTSAFSVEKMYDADDQKVIDSVKDIVLRIAEEGHYIIVGRAASVITREIPGNINIKLQAPLEWRVNRIMQISNMTYAEAQAYVLEIDRQRELFVEHIAGRKLNNSDFDMIFNYATMLDDHIVDAIISVLKNKKMIIHSEEDY
jgi:cytidylate kinase